MRQPPPPFACTYSRNFPELLMQLQCSLAISTYQAGKVIFVSPKNVDELVQLPRNFDTPMGMTIYGQRLAVATKQEIVVLANAPLLASGYPRQPNTYDGLYVPRATYFTGTVSIHDLAWGTQGLWAVNTLFSCLALVDDEYSFKPQWQPSFITDLAPHDRCHLNGMAMVGARPKYVTALGSTDEPGGWRDDKASGGVLIDVDSGETILRGLSMPHSPRVYDGKLYVLISGEGQLVSVDAAAGTYDVVATMPGFVRGMIRYGDYAFIGLSRLRATSRAFGDLPIAERSVHSGIYVVYLPGGNVVGHLRYEQSCEEIYDVAVLPGVLRPGLMGLTPNHRRALSLPTSGFWAAEEPDDNTPELER